MSSWLTSTRIGSFDCASLRFMVSILGHLVIVLIIFGIDKEVPAKIGKIWPKGLTCDEHELEDIGKIFAK